MRSGVPGVQGVLGVGTRCHVNAPRLGHGGSTKKAIRWYDGPEVLSPAHCDSRASPLVARGVSKVGLPKGPIEPLADRLEKVNGPGGIL